MGVFSGPTTEDTPVTPSGGGVFGGLPSAASTLAPTPGTSVGGVFYQDLGNSDSATPTAPSPAVTNAVASLPKAPATPPTNFFDNLGNAVQKFPTSTGNPNVDAAIGSLESSNLPGRSMKFPLESSPLTDTTANNLVDGLTARGDALTAQNAALGKIKVDPTDPNSVANFNAQVNDYNGKVTQFQSDLASSKGQIDQFNMAQGALNVFNSAAAQYGQERESLGPSQETQLERGVGALLVAGGLAVGAVTGIDELAGFSTFTGEALAKAVPLAPMLTKAVLQGVVGLGVFKALDLATAGIKQNASDNGRLLLFMGELFAAGGILHNLDTVAPKIGDAIFQTYSEKYNAPKTVYFDGSEIPQKIASVPDSPEHQALIDALSSDGKIDKAKVIDAMRNGTTIKVPATVIKSVAETPFWTSVKSAFGVTPGSSEDTVTLGKGEKAPQEHNLLPSGKEAPTAEDFQNIADQVKARSEASGETPSFNSKPTPEQSEIHAQSIAISDAVNKGELTEAEGQQKLQGLRDSFNQTLPATEKPSFNLKPDMGFIGKDPVVNLKRDLVIRNVAGEKVTLKSGDAYTPHLRADNKILLQDGVKILVNKSTYETVKQNSKIAQEAKPFAPELKNTEETVKGQEYDTEVYNKYVRDLKAKYDPSGRLNMTMLYDELPEAEQKKFIELKLKTDVARDTSTKYSAYQLPGGENYKEILIQAPLTKDNKLVEERKALAEIDRDRPLTGPEQRRYTELQEATKGEKVATFKSSHWEEPNVIAHVRMNERTYNGQKVAFMEEAQSDWAREARSNPALPTNPLLKNWQELAIKRALQEAVASGAKYFAWTNGEQQQARYNLSKEVDNIEWLPGQIKGSRGTVISIRPKNGGSIDLVVSPEDGKVIRSDKSDWENKNLSDVIGKGIAEKILASGDGKLEGNGLNIGGEWASNLYDKQIPNIVEKLTGEKPEKINIPLKEKDPNIHYQGPTYSIEKLKEALNLSRGNKNIFISPFTGEKQQFSFNRVSITNPLKEIVKAVEAGTPFQEAVTTFGNREIAKWMGGEQVIDPLKDVPSEQQAIEITPEVKAIVNGEAPQLKQPSNQSPQFNQAAIERPELPERLFQPQRVESYIDRLKLRGVDPVELRAIITPDSTAWGVSYGNKLGFTDIVQHLTEDHEIFHQVFSNMENMRVFKDFDKAKLLDQARALYGDLTPAQLEENLARDFQHYVNDVENGKATSFWGKILEFFQRLYTSLKQIFSSDRDIKDFYDAVQNRTATEDTDVKVSGNKQFNEQFSPGGTVDFGEGSFNEKPGVPELRQQLETAQGHLDMAVSNSEVFGDKIPELKAKVDDLRKQIADLKNPPGLSPKEALAKVENRVGLKNISIDNLLNQRDRTQESLRAAQEQPEAHIKAYGRDKVPEYKAKIASLNERINDAKQLTENAVKVVQVSGKNIELPDELQQKAIELEIRKEAIDQNPLRSLLQFVSKKGQDAGHLPEETGGKSKFRQKGESLIAQALPESHQYSETKDLPEVREMMDKYLDQRKELAADQKKFTADKKAFIDSKKDEIAQDQVGQKLAKITQGEIKKGQDLRAKYLADAQKKADLEVAQARVNALINQKQDLQTRIRENFLKPKENDKLNTINPLKTKSIQQNHPGLVKAWQKYTSTLDLSRLTGLKHYNTIPEVDKLGTAAFDLYQEGYLPEPYQTNIKAFFDYLYQVEKGGEFEDLKYISNYLPQVYAGNAKDIDIAMREKLSKMGMTPAEIEKYMQGQKLSPDQSVHLKLNPFFSKDRFFQSYAEAATYGLLPKLKTMSELMAYRESESLKTRASRGLISDLEEAGELLQTIPKEGVNSGWLVNTYGPHGIEGMYSSPIVHAFLQNYFKGLAEADTLSRATIIPLSKISKFIQFMSLSAGVPFTPIDPFSLGILSREISRGNFKVIQSYIRSFSTKATRDYLKSPEHYKSLEEMTREGIPVRPGMAGFNTEKTPVKEQIQTLKTNVEVSPLNPKSYSPVFGIFTGSLRQVFGKKAFENLIPMTTLQTYEDIRNGLVKNGQPYEESVKQAADITKQYFGIIQNLGRGQMTEAWMSAFLYAPQYRESMVNIWTNMISSMNPVARTLFLEGKKLPPGSENTSGKGKYKYTFLGEESNIRNRDFRRIRLGALGLLTVLTAYNLLNKKLSGHYMWENPAGKEFDLEVSLPNGQIGFTPWEPSFATIPRAIGEGVAFYAQGDTKSGTEAFGQVMSSVVSTGIDILTNVNYFGNPIYKTTDSAAQRYEKLTAYGAGEVVPPYIKSLVGLVTTQGTPTPMPLYQAVVAATALPMTFSTTAKQSTNDLFNAIDAQTQASVNLTDQAESEYANLKELSKLDPTSAQNQFAEIYKSNPALGKEIVKIGTADKEGINSTDRAMLLLDVTNGDRAKYVYQQIMALPKAQRANYYQDLLNKKIVTSKVNDQIEQLMQNQ